ncbi:cysteine hydrolase [Faecalicatena contorta]|uniref:cysteine hydrolase family protein n=1 Tax=Faecalicatena contorta TaxID=39482 RepID=UPI002EAE6E68|nr:isochorismatase family cysteine hydrolase [Muricomes sp.]
MKVLVVVDMQNDFINGALGTAEAQAIVPKVAEKIRGFEGRVLATRDTHEEGYLDTQEGEKLPVIHCIRNSPGWQIHPEIAALLTEQPVDKPTFGSVGLGQLLSAYHIYQEPIESITLIGVCTDICVISNALLLKSYMPEVPVIVDASCCAGVTPDTHRQALEAMKVCQIDIVNE